MENPCESCLVRVTCGRKMCKGGYLIIEYVTKCPYAKKYLDKNAVDHPIKYYHRIYDVCKSFGIEDSFLWHASSI